MVTHGQLMARILSWAEAEENIRAVILTGSSSRENGSHDEFSDRDVELVCRDPEPLLRDDAWIRDLAPVWSSLYLANDDGTNTRLVFFEDATKIDFSVNGLWRLENQINGGMDVVYAGGYRVLIDKDGRAASLPKPPSAREPAPRPTSGEFDAVVREFWFEAAHMPTYLSRDDLWVVKTRDWTMKDMLLRMLEWHARAMAGDGTDTWYAGTKMKQWIAPDVWNDLHDVFGSFGAPGAYDAIVSQMELFTRLTHDVAGAWNLTYDPTAEQQIAPYVLSFAGRFSQKR